MRNMATMSKLRIVQQQTMAMQTVEAAAAVNSKAVKLNTLTVDTKHADSAHINDNGVLAENIANDSIATSLESTFSASPATVSAQNAKVAADIENVKTEAVRKIQEIVEANHRAQRTAAAATAAATSFAVTDATATASTTAANPKLEIDDATCVQGLPSAFSAGHNPAFPLTSYTSVETNSNPVTSASVGQTPAPVPNADAHGSRSPPVTNYNLPAAPTDPAAFALAAQQALWRRNYHQTALALHRQSRILTATTTASSGRSANEMPVNSNWTVQQLRLAEIQREHARRKMMGLTVLKLSKESNSQEPFVVRNQINEAIRERQQIVGNDKCRILERNGVKYHLCLSCGKEVVGRGDFNKHYRTHTNEKPYQCRADPKCGKRFGDASTRVRHERVHDMKRYECRHCKFLYTRKDNRDRHEIKCNGGQRKRRRTNNQKRGGIITTWNPDTISFDREEVLEGSNSESDGTSGSGIDVTNEVKKETIESEVVRQDKVGSRESDDPMAALLEAASQVPRAK